MRVERFHRSLTLIEALLIYFSISFIWEMILSPLYGKFDNAGFLTWAGSATSLYLIAKILLRPDFFGRSLRFSDVLEIFITSIATVLVGIGSWSLLVYADATINGHVAMERWGLIPMQEFKEIRWSVPWIIGNVLVSAFLVPIIEEIVFRGLILQRLQERYTPLFAVIISAGIFGLFHYDRSFIGAFLHGLVFGFLAIRMSSIYAPIIVHCLYNLTAFMLRNFGGISIVGNKESLSDLTYWAPELLCGLAGLAILVTYFLWVSEKTGVKNVLRYRV